MVNIGSCLQQSLDCLGVSLQSGCLQWNISLLYESMGDKRTVIASGDHCCRTYRRKREPFVFTQRWYNTRHDAGVQVVESGIKSFLSDQDHLMANLHSHHPYVFPLRICHTDLRPDLVIWNTASHKVYLINPAICYKTRYIEAHTLKQNKYMDLVEDIREVGAYRPQLITLKVDSQGPFHLLGCSRLRT